ncbi:hypothetical protein EGR_04629 [Echinococcus granulosus]|uniref:Uncharacterized protein n=1 Tax=Echinococcus granulosus TaxID=6210 RepID=W6UG35_ECHGR|nr:hypothetical protein EGR_04629 [Echinococcus granulosus]EUB60435.1 hypothetical protein EGR_04629 [Echinococcus granulosus]
MMPKRWLCSAVIVRLDLRFGFTGVVVLLLFFHCLLISQFHRNRYEDLAFCPKADGRLLRGQRSYQECTGSGKLCLFLCFAIFRVTLKMQYLEKSLHLLIREKWATHFIFQPPTLVVFPSNSFPYFPCSLLTPEHPNCFHTLLQILDHLYLNLFFWECLAFLEKDDELWIAASFFDVPYSPTFSFSPTTLLSYRKHPLDLLELAVIKGIEASPRDKHAKSS